VARNIVIVLCESDPRTRSAAC